MIGLRTRYSLVQFLELYENTFVEVLLKKHNIDFYDDGDLLAALDLCLTGSSENDLLSLLEEIARTSKNLRTRVEPKYSYDERFSDLCNCLLLDGYLLHDKSLIQTDPSIGDGISTEDDLVQELEISGLSEAKDIVARINASSDSFRSVSPNFNACLNDARVALETLACAIARTQSLDTSPSYDEKKWGSILTFLRQIDFVTQEEERGLAGVYSFISPGAHRPIGFSEKEMTRLGRSLSLNMCWFLIKCYQVKNKSV